MHNATAIVCLEGNVVETVSHWLRRHLDVAQLNLVTDTAPEQIIIHGPEAQQFALQHQLAHIWETQGAQLWVLVAHANCVGYARQWIKRQQLMLHHAAQELREWYPGSVVVALWMDEQGTLTPLSDVLPAS
jgi:hypothetical protein